LKGNGLVNIPVPWIRNGKYVACTLPETNIAPENRPWKRRFLLETTIFRFYVSFREGTFPPRGLFVAHLPFQLHHFLTQLCTSGARLMMGQDGPTITNSYIYK